MTAAGRFRRDAALLGVNVTDEALRRFAVYADALLTWNARMNLIADTDEAGVYKRHFLDSLTAAASLDGIGAGEGARVSVIDVGSGAGFPGVPLKIIRPDIGLTLLDATNKKINFLNELIDRLGLSDAACVCARAEEAGRGEMRERFDIAVSRAVAALPVLAEYCMPFVRPGGVFIALKGRDAEAEAAAAGAAIQGLGGGLTRVRPAFTGANPRGEYKNDDDYINARIKNLVIGPRGGPRIERPEPERYIVEIKKITNTPDKYPRKNNQIIRGKEF